MGINGEFDEELYTSICLLSLEVPPLNERVEDIPYVAQAIIDRFRERFPNLAPKRLSRELADYLKAREWPGNFEQLKCEVEWAASIGDDEEITLSSFEESLATRAPTSNE